MTDFCLGTSPLDAISGKEVTTYLDITWYVSGEVMWSMDYGAPVVAMYQMDKEVMRKVAFTSMALETLEHINGQLTSTEWQERFLAHGSSDVFLYVSPHQLIS